MRGSPCQVKRVPNKATSTKPLGDWRKSVPLLSSIQQCNKFGIDQRRKEHLEASLLYQPSISRSISKLPKDGKDSFRIIGRLDKTPSLLPSTPHCHHDRPAHKKDDEQDRCNRTTHSMGKLNQANLTSNIDLEQQSKPKYCWTSLQNSLTPVRKKNPPWKYGRSKQMGQPQRKWEKQEQFSYLQKEKR